MKYSETDKDKILYILFTLRAISRHDILIEFDTEERKKVRVAINDFKRFKYIHEKVTINGHRLLYITKKGYEYIVNTVLKTKNPQYKYNSNRSRRSPLYAHHYMNFKFVWDYVHANWDLILQKDISIFTDQDIVNCKLKTDYEGKPLIIRPDVLVNIPKAKNRTDVVLVENDTARENPVTIYRKFLQYALFLLDTKRYVHIDKVTLHFIFTSKQRMENLFEGDVISNRFKLDNKLDKWIVDMKDVVKAFKSEDFKLFISHFKKSKPVEIDFLDTLKNTKYSWKHYLS